VPLAAVKPQLVCFGGLQVQGPSELFLHFQRVIQLTAPLQSQQYPAYPAYLSASFQETKVERQNICVEVNDQNRFV
jgi:hypothetical protein